MVGRPGKFQPRFTSGELDPRLHANTDLKFYATGASRFENVRPLPQGGFSQAWGLRRRGRIRGAMDLLSTAGAIATAPAGNPAAVLDGDETTFHALDVGPAAIEALRVVLPTAVPCTAVDLLSFGAALPGGSQPTHERPKPPLMTVISGAVTIRISTDGLTWTTFAPFSLTDTLRTRRAALPPARSMLVRYVSILVEANVAAQFYLNGLALWHETETATPARMRAFAHSRDLSYDLVLTAHNIDVWSAAGLEASIPTPYAADQIAAIKHAALIDTLLLFHTDTPPQRIQRQGSDAEWNIDLAPFRNAPNYDFGDVVYTNGTPAVWIIEFINTDTALAAGAPGIPAGGVTYTITVNGVTSPAMQQPPFDYSSTAADLQAAILALPGVAPGVTVTLDPTGQKGNHHKFIVTFAGADNQGDGWAIAGNVLDKADAAVMAGKRTVGVLGGEPIMSAARGWPCCATFFQQRLILGGMRSARNCMLASEQGDYYQLDTRLVSAAAPMLIPLDMDGDEGIVHLHFGRTLVVFATDGEFWLQSGTLARTTTPVFVLASRNGSAQTVPPVENEGATVYCAQNRGSFFEFKYDYTQQNYASSNMSVLSAALARGLDDAALRRLTGSTDVNELFAVRDDGLVVQVSLLRQQDVTAYARRSTDGRFIGVCVNARLEVSFVVERDVDGARVRFLERMSESDVLDCCETVSLASPGVLVSGLDNFEGAEVWTIADGYVQGPFVVAGGQITLGFAASEIVVGRWLPPLVRTLPQPREIAPRTVMRRPARVHTVRAQVTDTTSIAIGANGEPPLDAPLRRFGQPADLPMSAAPYSGEVAVEGISGFSDDAIVEITQVKPGLLTVIGVTVEVDL